MEEHEIAEVWKAYLLSHLYSKRPRTQDLRMDHVAEATGLCPEEEAMDFFDDVIDWLIGEDLLALSRGQRTHGQAFAVRLTSKGLGLMAREEAGWTGTVGEQAAKALKGLPAALVSGGLGMAFMALRKFYGLT